MSYVSVEELQKYSSVYGEASLQQGYIDAAENIVNTYLGYSPTLHNYIHLLDGSGTGELQLKAKPVQSIIEVKINGEVVPAADFTFTDDSEFVYYPEPIPRGKQNVKATYNAGWGIVLNDDDANSAFLPAIIKMTVLRIATMLQAEADSNIAITSKSFGDSGTRTFVNYTNYDKYLLPISIYKILVI